MEGERYNSDESDVTAKSPNTPFGEPIISKPNIEITESIEHNGEKK